MSYDPEPDFERSALDDDRLKMLFTCCHPALNPEARMALTLRSVGGLTVPEIARAFLSSESAMERRLVRARRKVTGARIPFRVPPDELLPERLGGVLRVVYLVYTEGHVATHGDAPVRSELCEEAIRLAGELARLMPDEAEALGLLALLLLTDARRGARVRGGELVLLEEQDRSLWDRARIEEGTRVLDRALRLGRAGPYVVQAAIAAVHAQAETFADTDWPQLAGLYEELARLDPSPVVAVNRAVAVGFAHGPGAGLAILDAIDHRRLERARAEVRAEHVQPAAGAVAGERPVRSVHGRVREGAGGDHGGAHRGGVTAERSRPGAAAPKHPASTAEPCDRELRPPAADHGAADRPQPAAGAGRQAIGGGEPPRAEADQPVAPKLASSSPEPRTPRGERQREPGLGHRGPARHDDSSIGRCGTGEVCMIDVVVCP